MVKKSSEENRGSEHVNVNNFEYLLEVPEFIFEEETYRIESVNTNEEVFTVFNFNDSTN